MHYRNTSELEKYRDQPYVGLSRVSDTSDEQNSDRAQLEYLKTWADERLMLHVRDYGEDELSGSLPGNRTDWAAILRDADTFGDFKYVLSQRIDRATRGGADHLFWLEFELKKRGIRVLYPGDGLPDGVPFQNTLRAAKADAAQETAMSTSQRTAQGEQYALEGRRMSPHSRTPFGCYRLFCRADGTPLYVIVDKRDGRQEKRSWPGLTLIDTYGTIGGGRVGHHRKQKSDLVFLVVGDAYERETVILIFVWYYVDGWSTGRIANELNRLGRPAPLGGRWEGGQVDSIRLNEDYTGRGIANRKSSARYNRRHHAAPLPVELDDKVITTAARITPITRPEDHWFEGSEPHLLDFLKDEQLRQVAEAKQRRYWKRRLDPTWTPKNKKKRAHGPYILWPLLVAKQDGRPLVGSSSGSPDKPVRVYRHPRGRSEAGTIFGRTFNAEALERAVLEVLGDILADWPELQPRLLAHAQQQIAAAGQHPELLRAKQEQRQAVRDQLLLYARQLTPKTQADLADEITRLEAQRDGLDAEIEMLGKQRVAADVNPHEVVAAMKDRLSRLADEVSTLAPLALCDVLAALTGTLGADMETKAVDFAFRLPGWMLTSDSKTGLAALCASTSSESSTGTGTQRDPALFVPLGFGSCRFTRHQRSVSCRCSRSDRRMAA
jgi:hypothetical protein